MGVCLHLKFLSVQKATIPDGFLLTGTNRDEARLWLVEYERIEHSQDEHISPQVIRFVRALRNPQTMLDLRDTIYNNLKDSGQLKKLRTVAGGEERYLIEDILKQNLGIIIVIDEVTEDLDMFLDNVRNSTGLETIALRFRKYSTSRGDMAFHADVLPDGTGHEATRTRITPKPEFEVVEGVLRGFMDVVVYLLSRKEETRFKELKEAILSGRYGLMPRSKRMITHDVEK